MKSKLFVLLPVHNRISITEKFIGCLELQTYKNYHLVLIDDGSTDGTGEMVKKRVNNLTIITGKGNWWWAGSLQKGIDWLNENSTDEDVVLFINDDVAFAPDFFVNGMRLLNQYGGMILPQVLNDETGKIEESGIEADLRQLTFKPASKPEHINCLPTRGLFMQKKVLNRVGGFYPNLLPHYLSDYEFTIRANRLGVSLSTSPDLIIRFDREATGYRNIVSESLSDFIKKYFSIKSALNPICWSNFALLVSPRIYIPWLLIKIWVRTARQILIMSYTLLVASNSGS